MESGGAPERAYVRWEEEEGVDRKRRREVRYYLKRREDNGRLDLAVIGKEKSSSSGHVSYHYVVRKDDADVKANTEMELRSRRDVINWLNSFISSDTSHLESTTLGGSFNTHVYQTECYQDAKVQRTSNYSKEFLWLGASSSCRKKRKHYWSFSRDGVEISVHDFVYVLAEENKRLIAYLEDMYEDYRGNKVVVVQWFHKIDEVDIILPHNFNDREIFFSLCLQDLSIECIDGLATVLSPQHFEKFLTAASCIQLQPFVCDSWFENGEVKPFDVTRLKGYWKQDIFRCIFNASPVKVYRKSQPSNGSFDTDKNVRDGVVQRPKKKHRSSKDLNKPSDKSNGGESQDIPCKEVQKLSSGINGGTKLRILYASSHAVSTGVEAEMKRPSQVLAVDSEVEVLSQDSGMQGCWFRASIVKKYKNKVKVRYQDILDADDETKKLEEWLSASRILVPDQLGIRMPGRMTVRPAPNSYKGKVSWDFDVGAAVDVWWNDGWWEGIVVQKESEDTFQVYFLGEKNKMKFSRGDMRHSQEWSGSEWKNLRERPDIALSLLSTVETDNEDAQHDHKTMQEPLSDTREPERDENSSHSTHIEPQTNKGENPKVGPDLSKDDSLSQLRWKCSRKRKRVNGSPPRKLVVYSEGVGLTTERFFISSSLNVDPENCKYNGDSMFSSSVVPPLASLVMSR